MLASGLVVEVDGAGAGGVPRDESHLVVVAMRAAFAAMGAQPPGLRLLVSQRDPARARARLLLRRDRRWRDAGPLAGRGGSLLLDDDALFRLAADLEGHPDNVAPAFYGGFVISGHEDGAFWAVSSAVDPRVSAVVFVPADGVTTSVARGLLPETVPHADAAADAGRAALLVAALAGRPEHLLLATRDYLHQEYRAPGDAGLARAGRPAARPRHRRGRVRRRAHGARLLRRAARSPAPRSCSRPARRGGRCTTWRSTPRASGTA